MDDTVDSHRDTDSDNRNLCIGCRLLTLQGCYFMGESDVTQVTCCIQVLTVCGVNRCNRSKSSTTIGLIVNAAFSDPAMLDMQTTRVEEHSLDVCMADSEHVSRCGFLCNTRRFLPVCGQLCSFAQPASFARVGLRCQIKVNNSDRKEVNRDLFPRRWLNE